MVENLYQGPGFHPLHQVKQIPSPIPIKKTQHVENKCMNKQVTTNKFTSRSRNQALFIPMYFIYHIGQRENKHFH